MQMRLMDTMRACWCCSPDPPPPLPLVIHGKDVSAPARGEYAGYVFKSQDDGDSWTTETGDIVTMAVNAACGHDVPRFLPYHVGRGHPGEAQLRSVIV